MSKKNDITTILPRCVHRHSILTHPQCFPVPRKDEDIRTIQPKKIWYEDLKIGFLDIETTHLKANMGIILCWYIKPEGGTDYDKYLLSRKEILTRGVEDKRSLQALNKALQKYDIIVTYYGKGFDAPFIRHRALIQGVDFPVYQQMNHLDMYFVVKSKLKCTRNSLDAACASFGIVGKTHINWEDWRWAAKGDVDALAMVDDHNQGDVDILEELYNKLKPHIRFSKTSI